MLELYNIQLQSTKKLFGKQTRRFIRISQKNNIGKSKTTGKYINQSTIEWSNPILFKPILGEEIDFQIYEKHQFGYNPEQISNLIYGSFKLNAGDKIVKAVAYSESQNNKKIGHLVINVKKSDHSSPMPNKSSVSNDVAIESILVRKLAQYFNKCYIAVKVNNKINKTAPIEGITKQFLSLQKIGLGELQGSEVIQFELYNHQTSEMAAKGKILYRTCKKSNRIDLFDSRGQLFADLYFQLANPKQMEASQISKTMTMRSKSNPNLYRKIREIQESRVSGQTQFLGTSRRKKISVVNTNNDIFAPSEKRFMIYSDKQTNIISYSKLPNMDFQETFTKKHYRGASFGKGQKTDFTRYYKGNPGVGDYKLPSIFDRY